jgi:tellurite resistance protein TerC
MFESAPPLLWIVFGVLVIASVTFDLGLHRRHPVEPTPREAARWAALWIALAVAFGLGVAPFIGGARATDYFTAWLLEKALSVDNLFVFIILFKFFKISSELQRRVLFWGIVGALALRAVFIFLGVALLHRFHFLTYVFGAFLIYTGGKLLFGHGEEVHPEQSFAYRLMRRTFSISEDLSRGTFFVREQGRLRPTRLLLVLVVVETTDVVFAVDSIPAVLAVTTDTFVVYTSNVFAILGLRALYFVLASVMVRFRYLNVGLALVLAFIGVKMLAVDYFKLPPLVSLAAVAGLLGASVAASLIAERRDGRAGRQSDSS